MNRNIYSCNLDEPDDVRLAERVLVVRHAQETNLDWATHVRVSLFIGEDIRQKDIPNYETLASLVDPRIRISLCRHLKPFEGLVRKIPQCEVTVDHQEIEITETKSRFDIYAEIAHPEECFEPIRDSVACPVMREEIRSDLRGAIIPFLDTDHDTGQRSTLRIDFGVHDLKRQYIPNRFRR